MNVQRLMLQLMSKLPQGILRKMGGDPIEARGYTLDPLMQIIWMGGKKQPPVESLSPQDVRAALDVAADTLQAVVPRSVSVREDSIPGPSGEIPVSTYTPSSTDASLPITLFFHFGGNVIGSRQICEGFCGLIAERANTLVINVEYRLAPEHPFPAAIEDAFAVYAWAQERGASLGGDPSRIVVAGDSAGGQLSAVISQEAKRQGWQSPECQVLIYPWLVVEPDFPSYTDFSDAYPLSPAIMQWFGSHYFSEETQKQHPWATPLNEPNLSGLPQALIYTAGFDPLVDEGARYAERLKEAGVSVHYKCFEHLTHSFTMFGGVVPEAQRAMEEIADEVGRVLRG